MKISVVTVCYNAVTTIEGTMLSVLNQTYNNVEYIVIDGGSTDGTVDIIKKYADRLAYWVSEPDKGIYDAMNKGIAVATGDYINFMNSGDTFSEISTVKNFISEIDSDTIIAYGNWNIFSNGIYIPRTPLNQRYIHQQIPFCHQAGFYKLSYHKKHPFSDKFKIIADYKFVYDAYNDKGVKFQYIPVCVANYDVTIGQNTSSDSFRVAYREKLELWGIKDNVIKRIPYDIKMYLATLSHHVKRLLPTYIVLRLKQFRRCLKSHKH